ncbi:unnamed protein product [Dimorphilus gyrociliatus]|uniref:Ubiquitin-like domain-containing protein n=1 Tax=Dimorphilus gyrociliatus TaxID=2664684 RepID=A0A7I8WAW1_9ANNE|nr:unnamed protein product [Dimorphilus gyrociliatus]
MNKERSTLLWSYKTPDKLLTVKLGENPVESVKKFIVNNLTIQTNYELVSIGAAITKFMPFTAIPPHALSYSVLLILPTKNTCLTIWMEQEKVQEFEIHLLKTVFNLKKKLAEVTGWPIHLIDFTVRGDVLENSAQLINLRLDDKIQLTLQPSPHFFINIETFWGKTYEIEINQLTTARQLIKSTLIQTLTDDVRFNYKMYLPNEKSFKHLIMIKFNGILLKYDECLNKYRIKVGDRIKLLTTGQERCEENIQVHLTILNGNLFQLLLAKYDNWFIAYLKLLSNSEIYVNSIKIRLNGNYVNWEEPILSSSIDTSNKIIIKANVDTINESVKKSSTECLQLAVRAPSGVIHHVQVDKTAKIRDVRRKLKEEKCMENLKHMKFSYDYQVLPSNYSLNDLSSNDEIYLELKFKSLPIIVKTKTNSSICFNLPINTSLREIIEKVKPGRNNIGIMMGGEYLKEKEGSLLTDYGLYVNSCIWLRNIEFEQIMYLSSENSQQIPLTIRTDGVDSTQLQELHLSPGSRISLQLFINWRYKKQLQFRSDKIIITSWHKKGSKPDLILAEDNSRLLNNGKTGKSIKFQDNHEDNRGKVNDRIKLDKYSLQPSTSLEYRRLKQQTLLKNRLFESFTVDRKKNDYKSNFWSSDELRRLVRTPSLKLSVSYENQSKFKI